MEQKISLKAGEFGYLSGRDCILIDSVFQDDRKYLTFHGQINGEDRYIPCILTFRSVVAYFACEVDTYGNLPQGIFPEDCDFILVEGSRWLEDFAIRTDWNKADYHHYQVYTYDYVYNVIAASYTLDFP